MVKHLTTMTHDPGIPHRDPRAAPWPSNHQTMTHNHRTMTHNLKLKPRPSNPWPKTIRPQPTTDHNHQSTTISGLQPSVDYNRRTTTFAEPPRTNKGTMERREKREVREEREERSEKKETLVRTIFFFLQSNYSELLSITAHCNWMLTDQCHQT